jgi:Flp pilus assembly protein TadG
MVMAAMKRLARGAQLARLRALISNFRLNKRGNVAVITALAILPMIAAVGCAVDYSMASMIKTKLQAAADAASLATVSINHRQGYDRQRHGFRRFDLRNKLF